MNASEGDFLQAGLRARDRVNDLIFSASAGVTGL